MYIYAFFDANMLGITIGLKQLALAFNYQWNIMYHHMRHQYQGIRSLYNSCLLQTHKQKSLIYFVPLELLGRGYTILCLLGRGRGASIDCPGSKC